MWTSAVLFSGILIGMMFSTLFGDQSSVFQSTLADKGWYQNDPVFLTHELHTLLSNVPTKSIQHPMAVIMPHAGYEYSGPVMAKAIAPLIGNTYERIIIIGPSHFQALPNQAAVLVADAIQTPLGTVPIDTNAVAMLLTKKGFINKPDVHPKEHSVQIEIPWVQVAFPDVPVVPIVLGQLDSETVMSIASILRPLLTSKTLLIISSDFTHYGESFNYVPFTDDIAENIKGLDASALHRIQKKDLIGFRHFIQSSRATICGEMPIQLLLELLPENATSNIVGYTTSGHLNNDWSHSVSYASVIFSGQWKNDAFNLTFQQADEDGKKLLVYARDCINSYLKTGKVEVKVPQLSSAFNQKLSAFVTLKKEGNLRGCIGSIFPTQSLVDEIRTQAINAAVNDPRFDPVTANELAKCEIEISILSPIKPCPKYEDIHLGKHGIILKKGQKQAVFLPQVPIEQDWDLAVTLTSLSLKAGLPANAWKSDAEFFVFEATVFSEN